MKLAFIIDSLKTGGKEQQLVYLLKELSQFHSILLIVFNSQIHYKEIYDLPLRLVKIPKEKRYSINKIRAIYHELKKFKPQIVHSWFDLGTAIILFFLLKNKGIKLVSSIRYAGQIKRSFVALILKKVIFKYSTFVVSNSKKGLFVENLENSSKGRVIYNGLDINTFQREIVRLGHVLKLRNGIDNVVTMVGNFTKAKDYDTFIKAAKIVSEKLPNVGFVCVGGGNEGKEFEKKADIFLNQNIFFLGLRNDIPALLNMSQIGVLLSNTDGHAEGISNSIMEYMAAGLPVIATDAGGTPEIVKDGHSGFLVPAFDVKVVAERIAYLLTNKEKAKELGRNGRKVIETEFSIQRMVKEYNMLYKELI